MPHREKPGVRIPAALASSHLSFRHTVQLASLVLSTDLDRPRRTQSALRAGPSKGGLGVFLLSQPCNFDHP